VHSASDRRGARRENVTDLPGAGTGSLYANTEAGMYSMPAESIRGPSPVFFFSVRIALLLSDESRLKKRKVKPMVQMNLHWVIACLPWHISSHDTWRPIWNRISADGSPQEPASSYRTRPPRPGRTTHVSHLLGKHDACLVPDSPLSDSSAPPSYAVSEARFCKQLLGRYLAPQVSERELGSLCYSPFLGSVPTQKWARR
jgi:hypothetical protein